MSPGGRKVLHGAGTLFGLALSAVLASTAFATWHFDHGIYLVARFSFADFAHDLPHHLWWGIVFLILSGLMLPFRAVQWQKAMRRRIPFSERYHSIAIGAFVHNTLPGKLGDLTRAFLLARTQGMTFVRSLGSVVVCKLMEFVATMILVGLALFGPLSRRIPKLHGGLQILLVVCVAFVLLVVGIAHFAAPLAGWLHRKHWLPRLQTFLHEVAEGLGPARSFRAMAVLLLFSFPTEIASVVGYGLGLSGVGAETGLLGGALVLGALSLSQSVPGMPSDVGIYYMITSWIARSLGASAAGAAAFSTLTYLGTILPQVLLGAVSLFVRKVKWSELRRRSHVAAEELKHLAEETVHHPVEA